MEEFDEVHPNPSYLRQVDLQELQLEKLMRHHTDRDKNIRLILHYFSELKEKSRVQNRFLFFFKQPVDQSQLSKLSDTELGNFADDFVLLMSKTNNLAKVEQKDLPLLRKMHSILSLRIKGGTIRRKHRHTFSQPQGKFYFLSPKSLRKHRAFYRTKKVQRAAKRADQALADMEKLI